MERQADRQTDGRMDGRMDGWMDGWMCTCNGEGRREERTPRDGRTDGRTDEWIREKKILVFQMMWKKDHSRYVSEVHVFCGH